MINHYLCFCSCVVVHNVSGIYLQGLVLYVCLTGLIGIAPPSLVLLLHAYCSFLLSFQS